MPAYFETVESTRPFPGREFDQRFNFGNLSPLEHRMFGATSPVDIQTGIRPLIQRVQEGDQEVKRLILTPMFLQGSLARLEDVRKARSKEVKNRSLRGSFPFIDHDQLGQFEKDGIVPYLEISKVRDDGLIIPSWRVFLISRDTGEVVESDAIRFLELYERAYPGLRLEKGDTEQYFRILTFSISSEQMLREVV